jgi:glycosyltransferase involved in cell wall biosynthesis
LLSRGIDTRFLVWNKESNDTAVEPLFNKRGLRAGIRVLSRGLGSIERRLSIHSRLQLQSYAIPMLQAFQEADVVHYHLIHNGFFSLDALPRLARIKPSVWTWHDPYPMTGHCVYPKECTRWLNGCGECPSLAAPIALGTDRTAAHHRWKKSLMPKIEARVVVASPWMKRMTSRSPIAAGRQIDVLPFGIDLNKFKPVDSQKIRTQLGISADQVVLGVRALPGSPYKGLDNAIKALRLLTKKSLPITILTTQQPNCFDEFKKVFRVIDMGWITNENKMRDIYAAMDIFLMPSDAEAFGVMAIEAMACERTVVVLDGTALPETTGAPEIGVMAQSGDSTDLASQIERLVLSPDERKRRGCAGRKLAERDYSETLFADRLSTLYKDIYNSQRKKLKEKSTGR